MEKYKTILKEEIKNRARIYYHIYRELSQEAGQDRAVAILKRAIYRRGKEKGLELARKIGEPDLSKVAVAFMESKEEVDVFGHEVVRVDQNHALLRLKECPLVEAWKELVLPPQEIRTMCDLAYQVDFGKFETAGYKLKFDCRIADGSATCDLHVTK